MAAAKKGGLGRGLEALIADAAPIENVGAAKEQSGEHEDSTDRVRYIKTFDIMPNASQEKLLMKKRFRNWRTPSWNMV